MTREGIPIHLHPLPRTVNSGIVVGQANGEVSEYDCRESCVYAHYNWMQWIELHWWERSMCVAQYRIHLLIDAHVNAAAHRDSVRDSKRAARK